MLTGLNLVSRQLEDADYIGMTRARVESVETADVVILGPSMAKNLYPRAMCLTGANIAETKQDYFEIEAIGNHLVARGHVPRLWIVGTMPDLYRGDNGAKGTSYSDRRIRTYRVLQSLGDWRLIARDWKGAVRAAVSPALGYDEWNRRIRSIRRKQPRRRIFDGGGRQSQDRIADAATDERLSRDWLGEVYANYARIEAYDPSVPQRALASLLRLNALLRAQGAQLVVVSIPYSPALNRQVAPKLAEDSLRRTAFDRTLAAAGAIVIDDTSSTRFSADLANFRDPSHLNRHGGMAYSRDLATRLATKGVAPKPDCDPDIANAGTSTLRPRESD